MAFSGWPEQALDFYEGLEADNSKTYWTRHKPVYEEHVLAPMRELIEELAPEFGEPKIFRPYRDVRFSADKTPYKTHIGARLGRTGYLQFSADGLAAGNGMYQLDPGQLARYRAAVADDLAGAELAAIVAKLESEGIEVHGSGTLKSAPRGYPADHQPEPGQRQRLHRGWKQPRPKIKFFLFSERGWRCPPGWGITPGGNFAIGHR